MRVRPAAGALALLLVGLAACGGEGSDGGSGGSGGRPASVKIGAPLSLSGTSALTGMDSREGIELAVKHLEAGILQGTRIELSVVDDASDPNQAVTAVQRLASQDVVALVGGTVSNAVQAAAPVAQRSQTPFVVVNSFSPTLTEVGDFIFQVSQPTGPFNAREVEAAVKAFSPQRAAIIYAQDVPTTVAFEQDFTRAFEAQRVPVVTKEAVRNTDADYSAAIRRVMSQDPDVVAVLLTGGQDALVIRQARALGFDPTFLGHIGDVNASFVSAAKEEGVGHIANTGFFADAQTEPVRKFVAEFGAAHGDKPTPGNGNAYQAMMMTGAAIAKVIEAGGAVNARSIRDALDSLGPVDSVLGSSGTAQFDQRILRYDGFLLRLNDQLQWEIWNP